MKYKISLFLLISYSLYANEPSAYGAGDLNTPNPYGLTEEEKVLLQTKQHLKKVEFKTLSQENKVNSLRERLDGLQSVVEGLARKTHQNQLDLKTLKEQLQSQQISNEEYQKRLEDLVTKLEDQVAELNDEYVSKKQLQLVVDDFNKFKKLVAKNLHIVDPLDKLSKAAILKKANRYYKKQYYTKAIEYYKYLFSHNYKPAYSSYMLGEIYYYRKKYSDALAYYKESARRYSKASYMPILLLHSAISMDKLNQKENAQRFFQVIVQKYPNTKAAKIAKSYIK